MVPKTKISISLISLEGYLVLNLIFITFLLFKEDNAALSATEFFLGLANVAIGSYFIFIYLSAHRKNDVLQTSSVTKEDQLPVSYDISFYKNFIEGFIIIYQSGYMARAIVESVSETGRTISGKPFLKVYLKVNTDNNNSFYLQAYTLTHQFFIPRIGDLCTIRLHSDYREVVILESLNNIQVSIF